MNHEIPTVIVAVTQAHAPVLQDRGHLAEGFSQDLDFPGADFGARPFYQAPLDEMFELPKVQLRIESLLKGDARVIAALRAALMQMDQLVDGFLVPGEDAPTR